MALADNQRDVRLASSVIRTGSRPVRGAAVWQPVRRHGRVRKVNGRTGLPAARRALGLILLDRNSAFVNPQLDATRLGFFTVDVNSKANHNDD